MHVLYTCMKEKTIDDSKSDLYFIIKGADVSVMFEEDCFSDEERLEIATFVDEISQRIIIDRSNVENALNKHSDVFLREDGWNFLVDTLVETKYGKYMASENQSFLAQAIQTMVFYYIMTMLSKKTDKVEHVTVSVDEKSILEIYVFKNSSDEWKAFKGSWKDFPNGYGSTDKKKRKQRKGP